jgi:hypothetical protein
MLHQIKVYKRHKSYQSMFRPEHDQSAPIILRPCLAIEDVVYWQGRISKLLPDCHVVCRVAK